MQKNDFCVERKETSSEERFGVEQKKTSSL